MSIASMAAQPSPLTERGMVVGTFQYLAPEVLQGKAADARSDIFALGAVLYEMISGKPAFAGKSQLSGMTAILEKEPEPISQNTFNVLCTPASPRIRTNAGRRHAK